MWVWGHVLATLFINPRRDSTPWALDSSLGWWETTLLRPWPGQVKGNIFKLDNSNLLLLQSCVSTENEQNIVLTETATTTETESSRGQQGGEAIDQWTMTSQQRRNCCLVGNTGEWILCYLPRDWKCCLRVRVQRRRLRATPPTQTAFHLQQGASGGVAAAHAIASSATRRRRRRS